MADEAQDEVASYFNRETTPKILITTTDRPRSVSVPVKRCSAFLQLLKYLSRPIRSGLKIHL